jgi:anti-sigma factor RsiW
MMFSCKDITEHASAYVDGKLSLVDRVKFRLHVFICHNCREYLAQFRAMIRSVARTRREPEAATIDDTVARLLRERDSGEQR